MPPGTDDPRKLFILTTAGNYFSLDTSASLSTCHPLDNFLDDGNEFLLTVTRNKDELQFSNKLENMDGDGRVLLFFKPHPCVVSEENLHRSVLVSSMLESPISTLYQALRQVYSPVLLQDDKWSQSFDSKLQSLLTDLEVGLGSVLRHSHPKDSGKRSQSETDVLSIMTPLDEFSFWADVSRSGQQGRERDRATHFSELFATIEKDYSNLDSFSLVEVLDLIESTRETVDDVWKQNEYAPYPETRMIRLMDVIGGALGRFVQRKLSALRLWEDPYFTVREGLKGGVAACEQWVAACEHLTGQVWKRYSPHPWSGEKHHPQGLQSLAQRLEEVVQVRSVCEKLQRLLSGGKQQVSAARVYQPFTGLNPIHYNPYTEPLWRAAVSQFDRLIAPAEQEAAGKLKTFIIDAQDSPQQLLQVFQKHRDLIKRPTISRELQPERETLLTRLLDYNKGLRADFESRCHGAPGEKTGPLAGRNLPEVVNNIVWARQLLLKVEDSLKMANALLSDLSGFRPLVRFCDELQEQMRSYEQEQFEDWTRDLLSGLSDPKSGISLQASNRVMELDHMDGKLKIQYSDRLVSLLREVRQLSALGFTIPAKIQQASNTADKFYRQAIILKQVAHFYNTIDQQMIPSQRPMMLGCALAFEQVIKNPRSQSRDEGGKLQITWENPKELEQYINKLQSAAERLSTENRKLRKWHTDFTDKVVNLMGVDLLRQQQRWKDGLQDLRTGFATLESQGFRTGDMRAWRQHWNHQLYKALEHQYQVGLEALNKNLPEINIDLIFKYLARFSRQGRLQFRPAFEEVRAKYYREMKRFICIPNQFKGVSETGEEPIFTCMIERNASGFLTIFSKAEHLFNRLTHVLDKFKDWVVLGQVDVDVLVEKHLHSVQDWERNFKALKAKGKEAERLPSTEKVDCITVNCEPVRVAVDDLIQRLFDALLTSLRRSIQGHIQVIDSFVSGAMETLSLRPESIDEIGEANAKHSQLQTQKPEILPQFQQAEEKNRLLRSVAGGGLDTISSLRAKWDKFELMMESHQLMIKEQVEVMKGNVESRVQVYLQDLQKFRARWDQLKPGHDIIESGDHETLQSCVQNIRDRRAEFDELEITRKKLMEDCEHFNLSPPDVSLATDTLQDLQECSEMWELYEEFQQGLDENAEQDWISFRSKTHMFEEFLFMWHDRLRKLEEHSSMSVKLQKEVDRYKAVVPVLKYVRGEHLSQEHWLDLFRLVSLPRGTTLERLQFRDLLRVADNIIDKALELKVLSWARESPPDPRKPLDTYYDSASGRLCAYELQRGEGVCVDDLSNPHNLPVIHTPDTQRGLDHFTPWLSSNHRQPFLLVGPEGCGKGMLLHCAFSQLRSTQVAVVHCSAQTSSRHILQKLSHTCLVISSNTGRVYRPKDCERLVLYLKDINLPKPDKWGTSNLIAFLQQVLTYQGFYDENLEWVGLENIQIVASMSAGGAVGRHTLTSRFTSIVRICTIDYPDREQLQTIYSAYLKPVLQRTLGNDPTWSSTGKIHQLAGSLVQVYEQVKAKFSVDDHSHYLFTPCLLTQWVLNLLRYDLSTGKSAVDSVLEVVAYEARRLFRDRIVSSKDLNVFDNILSSVIRGDWGSDTLDNMTDTYFVTWAASHEGRSPGQPLPPHGKSLGRLNASDLSEIVHKGIVLYGRDNRELDILLFPEVLDYMSRVDRVLSSPGGSLLLAGRSGVGRRTATCVVSHMHGASLFTPKISRSYSLKHFKSDLKTVMQSAAVNGQQVVLLLEDHQFVHPSFLEMVNSLLSSGEVPGLYSTEELEPLLSSLKDQASQDGFTGPVLNYFSHRVQQNLHVVLIMDCTNEHFTINCESNPALYRKCSVQWMEGWSDSSMKKIPEMLLSRMEEEDNKDGDKQKKKKKSASVHAELYRSFLAIHESCGEFGATPSQYLSFLQVYQSIYSSKRKELTHKQQHLQAGVAKLNEAKALVDELKRRAAEQSSLLKTKQAEADAALQEITTSMQNASDQKTEMEKIKERMAHEVSKIEERKKKIDEELREVQPLVEEAKQAVGNIKSESLSEIRSLRMPPDVIRDILEGVLRLMGIFDTSWVSMKSFLAKRGVREDIVTFDARSITHEIRQSVEELLHRNKASFDPKNAKRASAAAAPLAAWVKANVQYSHVLEKIQPLETEHAGLMENLRKTENRKNRLEKELNSVGEKVLELKEKFQCRTTEAAKLESEVSRAQETISAAENLLQKLDGEHTRWTAQVDEIREDLDTLPKRAQLSAAFITYLPAAPEDQRRSSLDHWMSSSGLQKFDLRHFLCSESEQLIWKSEGLPSDDLSMENALVILQNNEIRSRSASCPFLIDPSSRATEWLRTHLKAHRLEVINQQDANFITVLELAVRFGKTLIIQEMDGVEPVLYPLLRRDLIAQGPRYVVQIGDKVIDYNEDFRLFLATRNPSPFIPPDAKSVITEVNFTTTRAGLRGQLLALTIQQEKPELESEKTKLLQQEEEKKIQLAQLEESLLETLATAQGNILENKELIESLNQTKASSALIHQSLSESHRLQTSLDQERDAYLPLAETASKMYFVITDLSKINNMYRFSLASFLRLFHRALQTEQESESTNVRISTLESRLKNMVYEYICRSLFKADQLMFALHFVKGMNPEFFQENEWDVFTGLIVGDMVRKTDSQKSLREQFPSWIDQERLMAVALLKSTFPVLYQSLCLNDSDLWLTFSRSSCCEQEIPPPIAKKISLFQQVLVVQALRPDRLQSSMAAFASQALDCVSQTGSSSADSFIDDNCPLSWQNKWEGPEDPMQYLRAVVSRALAIQGWVERAERGGLLSEMLDLSELFHPDTFLNALRQETARLMSCSMDSLKFVASWRGQIADTKLQVKVGGLQLEGCVFDGNRLAESHHDSPSVSAVPACYMAWIPQDYRAVVDALPEDDRPSFFGLPANIERSAQRIISLQVISQLRILSRSVAAGSKFDRDVWSNALSPVLNLWKRLNQGSSLIHQKVALPSEGVGSPVLSFIQLEQFNAVRLVQSIHQSLASLSKVIRGTSLLTADVHKLATALLNQECPLSWQNKWEGPEDPMQYLRAVVSRALAIQGWVERAERGGLLSEMLDLSELFHPDTFLNALRQETARLMSCSMDSLKFVASWRGQIADTKLQVKVGGLQLEGCVFDGNRLAESHHDSPSVSAVPACYMAWIPQSAVGSYSPDECISLPVYSSAERQRVVTNVQLPCAGDHDTWIQSGAALFLKQQ
ncbi:cytoplasmic dynein 2 heavy chain 1-like [Garra rufa]|uniref:cytoplasmic dynein 2 heavy chain 1-like n=1 Tax=Garra rufa TaxID=137080 RepID=UPI003CCE57B8